MHLVLGLAYALLLGGGPPPWQTVRNDAALRIWARTVTDSTVREVKAQTVIDAPAERVFEVVDDVEHYKDFMPYVVEARDLAIAPPAGAEATRAPAYQYFRIDPPVIKQRDYTLAVTHERDPHAGIFVRSWRAAKHHGPPPRKDSVRLAICDGSWTVRRLSRGRAEVTYWVYSDPEGSLPGWLVNHANKKSLPEVMEAVRQRALDPTYTR